MEKLGGCESEKRGDRELGRVKKNEKKWAVTNVGKYATEEWIDYLQEPFRLGKFRKNSDETRPEKVKTGRPKNVESIENMREGKR